MKFCKQCKNEFEITETDKEFYHKMDVSEPERCSVCRARRRLSFRNERMKKNIIEHMKRTGEWGSFLVRRNNFRRQKMRRFSAGFAGATRFPAPTARKHFCQPISWTAFMTYKTT